MPRRKIAPDKRKKTVSITLKPEQIYLLQWVAAATEEGQSPLVGRLIETEARRVSKRLNKEPPPMPEPEQLQWTAAGQVEAVASVRGLIRDGSKSRGRKNK